MRVIIFSALISILFWSISLVQNASAESAADLKRPPVMKQYTGVEEIDPVSRRFENMINQLGLSTEQQAEIKKILLDENVKLKDFRANAKQNPVENKAKMQELRNDTNNKIRLILSTEQQKKRDIYIKDISERRKSWESK